MNHLHVAAAVLNQTPMDWGGNADRIRTAISQARSAKVSVLCLPELCITGYGCEDMFQSSALVERAGDVLLELIPETRGMVVAFGLPLRHRNALFNAAALVVDGRLAGFAAKQNLSGDGIHYEPRWFKPWPENTAGLVDFGGERHPVGDLLFDIGGLRMGFEICEDAWAAKRPGADLARRGVDLVLNPSASHFAFGKHEVRERFVLEGSRAFAVTYLYANLSGNESGRAIYDAGALIASNGKLVAVGPRFTYREVVLTSAVVDIEHTRLQQARLASVQPEVQDGGADLVRVDFECTRAEPVRDPGTVSVPRFSKEEAFTRAVALALYDYRRKSGCSGFVLSLSGGADSSAVACLVGKIVELAKAEIEVDLPMPKLLTGVYQGTVNSSEATRHAARTLAGALGAEYIEWEVDELVAGYTGIVETALARELDWDRDDIALQNIQARVRAPGVWMIANLRNGLLLSTSNRSEAAVGYATMDGDTAGGLCPVAGIDKAFLLHWLRWLETDGGEGIAPVPALAAVNALKPSAELRPPDAGQVDEDDLMPYDILEEIEDAAIRDKKMPLEVFARIKAQYPDRADGDLVLWITRFFQLWSRNQWKRERYAPSFHLDDRNLDPKTWCRFPILSGGYETELQDLQRQHGEP